ncbi:hypothetical protein FA15DRAFT_429039 [Coprinopsis marcescibilis]|uniref:Defective in cullin neddylation protein n=1 Tax=Coprinopsis marcescibilis TaxID=230819 RepID=A0A5C3LKI5_COPMA|nr:hypothetical protein FA15DRAFT_429039 [Coprinopsis marcescibilis]
MDMMSQNSQAHCRPRVARSQIELRPANGSARRSSSTTAVDEFQAGKYDNNNPCSDCSRFSLFLLQKSTKQSSESFAVYPAFPNPSNGRQEDGGERRSVLRSYRSIDTRCKEVLGNIPSKSRGAPSAPSTSKLNALFDKYKDPNSDEISIDGTISLCEDLNVDPEDVVMLAVATELKSPRIGEWTRQGWVDGWKALG